MIKKLILTRYGKFSDKSFEFSGVNVFFGKNEAGKTTIFDAIFEKICKPKGNASHSKELKKRYGDSQNRVLSVAYDGDEFSYDEDEFLNLYAVKAGDISNVLSPKNDWVSKIQSSLFTGGIDPAVICKELEGFSSKDGKVKHMKDITGKQKEIEKLNESLKKMQTERDSILKSEKEISKSSDELSKLSGNIKSTENQIEKNKKIIETQEKLRRKNNLFGVIDKINAHSELSNKIAGLSIYEKDCSAEAERLSESVQKAKNDCNTLGVKAESAAKEIESLQKESDEIKRKAESMSIRINPLTQLFDFIENECPKSLVRQSVVYNKPLAAAGFIFLLAGVLTALYMGFSPAGLGIMAAGAIAAIVLLFVSRKTITVQETPEIESFTRKAVKRWNEITGGGEHDLRTLSELREEIIKFKSDYSQALNIHSQLAEKINNKNDLLKKAQSEYRIAETDLKNAEDALSLWYQKMNVKDLRQYGGRISEYETVKKQLLSVESELKQELLNFQCDNFQELKTKAETLASQLESELSGIEKLSDAELGKLKNEVNELSSKLESLRSQEKSISEKYNKGSGQISGALGNMPETIASLQHQIALLTRELRDLEINRRAAGFAAKIFEEISKDSSLQFGIVSRDIAERFSDFLPVAESVRLGSFNSNDIAVMDAGGEFRQPEQLSTGTRDAFWFAARLSLALKANPEGRGIIILDEPFHAFDKERVEKAVRLLKKFRDNTKWQVILFTKDEHVAETMKKEFTNDIISHDLN